MYLNETKLMGHLGSDPEIRNTDNGNKVCNVNLATTEYYKNAKGEKISHTEWHRLVFWNRQAEIISEYAKSGSHVMVLGKNQTQFWEKEGLKHQSTVVVVGKTILLDKKGSDKRQGPPPEQPDFPDKDVPHTHDEFIGEEADIPF